MVKLQQLTPQRTALICLLIGLLAVAISMLWLDRPISSWSHAMLHKPGWCKMLTRLADVPVPASLIGLIGAGIAWLAGWRPGPAGRIVLAIFLASLAADSAKDLLKFAFGRPWPETWVNNNPSWIDTHFFGFVPFHGGPGFAAFPSGHTTRIATPCAILWRRAPRLWPLWAALPAAVIIGLIGCDYHFLSDCIAGLLVGAAFGLGTDGALRTPAAAAG